MAREQMIPANYDEDGHPTGPLAFPIGASYPEILAPESQPDNPNGPYSVIHGIADAVIADYFGITRTG